MPPDKLKRLMREHLEKAGKSIDYILGYTEAMELCGYLKPTAPEWLRRSGAIIYAADGKNRRRTKTKKTE